MNSWPMLLRSSGRFLRQNKNPPNYTINPTVGVGLGADFLRTLPTAGYGERWAATSTDLLLEFRVIHGAGGHCGFPRADARP